MNHLNHPDAKEKSFYDTIPDYLLQLPSVFVVEVEDSRSKSCSCEFPKSVSVHAGDPILLFKRGDKKKSALSRHKSLAMRGMLLFDR